MRDADTRKVQQVGGTTLTVSIPKEWADAVSLEAGDEVTFTPNEDGSLTLRAHHETDDEPVMYVIDADACGKKLLDRLIVAGYIIGYERLRITAESLDHETTEVIHRAARRLTGLDIVEREDSHIELHNFMEVGQSGLYSLMRRLQTTVLHMLDSCVYALVQGRTDLLEDVREMEDDVDVLYWLILRQLLSAVDDASTMDDIGVDSPLHIVGNRTVIKSLEGIADSIEGLGEQIEVLIGADVDLEPQQQEMLASMTEDVHDMIETVTEGLIEQDIQAVNAVLEQDSIMVDGETFLDRLEEQTNDTEVVVAGNRFVWHMEHIEEFCVFIAEIAINRSMEADSSFGRVQDPQ